MINFIPRIIVNGVTRDAVSQLVQRGNIELREGVLPFNTLVSLLLDPYFKSVLEHAPNIVHTVLQSHTGFSTGEKTILLGLLPASSLIEMEKSALDAIRSNHPDIAVHLYKQMGQFMKDHKRYQDLKRIF